MTKGDHAPFAGEPFKSKRMWLRPELEIVIQALPRGDGHLLRHATLIR